MKQIIIRMPDEDNPKFIALLDEMRLLPQILIKEQAIDLQDFGVQIDKLRSLSDGWMNGQGIAPDTKGLDWLAHALDLHWLEDLPKPWFGPNAEGGVEAEWRFDDMDASLEINLERKTAYWHLLNLTTEEFEERDLDLTNRSDWDWLTDQFKNQKVKREISNPTQA